MVQRLLGPRSCHNLLHALISNGIRSFPNPARRKSRSAAASARKSTGKRASSRRATGSLGGTPAAKRSERFAEVYKGEFAFLDLTFETPSDSLLPTQAAASWGTPGAAAERLSEDESDDEEIEEQWLGRVGPTGEKVPVTWTVCSESSFGHSHYMPFATASQAPG